MDLKNRIIIYIQSQTSPSPPYTDLEPPEKYPLETLNTLATVVGHDNKTFSTRR